jgi:predicted O-methyltransferase YrrM
MASMARMFSARALATLLRTGNLRARLRATREGQTAVRLQLVTAALDVGVLDALAEGPATTADLAARTGATDHALLEAFLRVVASAGLITGDDGGPWRSTSAGRAVVEDDLVRASYEAFGDFHTGVYRDLRSLLTGGPRRRDAVEKGEVIARVSAAFDPFVHDLLARTVAERRPRRVLDVGCGAGLQLAAMLEAAPEATGVGVDVDSDAAALAERTLRDRGLTGRATIETVDVRTALAGGPSGALADPVDFALLANVVYYLPPGERVDLLRAVAGLLSPGGALMVITTATMPQLFARHFDLFLRAQEGEMQLPDADTLVRQLQDAGLRPDPPVRIAPGMPLIAVTAVRPG